MSWRRTPTARERSTLLTEAQREELKHREGESPQEWKTRTDGLMEKWDRERREELRAKREGRPGHEARPSGTTTLSRGSRAKSQERDVEKAVEEFEAAKKRLYRRDGSRVYGEAEHAERLGKLAAELRERAEAVAAEAQGDAEGYDRELLALSYTDPAETVAAPERGRLEAARAFIKEDCEDMSVPALTERISAVGAGSDRAAKVLHARYGRRRLEVLDAESNRLASEGRPAGAEVAAERRGLGEAVSALEAQLEDPKRAERAERIKEAAAESRRVAREARRKLSDANGTSEAARRAARERMISAF